MDKELIDEMLTQMAAQNVMITKLEKRIERFEGQVNTTFGEVSKYMNAIIAQLPDKEDN